MSKINRFTVCMLTIALVFNMFPLVAVAEEEEPNVFVTETTETETTTAAETDINLDTEAENETSVEINNQDTNNTINEIENFEKESAELSNEEIAFYSSDTSLNEHKDLTLENVELKNENNVIEINSGDDLIKLSHVNPELYKNTTLRFISKSSEFDTTGNVSISVGGIIEECTFIGLDGFEGTISVLEGSENYPIKLVKPLFNTLSDKAKIETNNNIGLLLMFVEKNGDVANSIPSALLAKEVISSRTTTNESWCIRVIASEEDGMMPPLIDTIGENAKVSLSLTTGYDVNDGNRLLSVHRVEGNINAGLLCSNMKKNASLTLTGLDTASTGMPSVTASNGDAGSLVGKMLSGAQLIVGEIAPLSIPNVTASGNAGGIIGSATDATFPQISLVGDGSTIKGNNAGGLIGSYIFSGENLNVKSSISGGTIVGVNGNAGGIFGELKNDNGMIEISSSVSVNVDLGLETSALGFGGIIGGYSAGKLDATLLLKQGSVTSSAGSVTSSVTGKPIYSSYYGGLIGWVINDSEPAYIEIDTTGSVTNNGIAANYGGLIGKLSDKGHYIKVGTVTVEISNGGTIKGNTTAGGLVGSFDSGILELSGKITTPTPECGNNYYRGNHVGQRGNTLVFNTYSEIWYFNKNGCNDIGNWGQVLQVNETGGLAGLLTISGHRVTVNGTNTNVDVSDKLSFAEAALRFQLDTKGALEITQDFDLDNVVLSMSGTVDLNGTGLTGFQRDYAYATSAQVTLSTNNATVIFPNIVIYAGYDGGSAISHTRQGLFSETKKLTVNKESDSSLTLNGNITVDAFGIYVFIGALAAQSSGNVDVTNVYSNTNLIIRNGKNEARISGLVAQQNGGNNTSVNFTGCKWNDYSDINSEKGIIYYGNDLCYLGGFLARAEKGNTITIENCEIRGTITKTGNGECFVGGLVASLRDKSGGGWNNYLTINGLTANGVRINTSSGTKTGGILGWEWMTVTADIQNVTLENCTLYGGNARFGGLVYKGSGYWKVYGNGIKFLSNNSFTGSSSQNAVSGLLLADGSKQEDHYNALYLEIADEAYTIANDSVTVNIGGNNTFDEIIGMTESENGNGIVSIGTKNSIESLSSSDCDYNKQLSNDYINTKTRYYYNLDTFLNGNAASGDIDNPGKLVLYSAYTHCYSGIKGYFYNNPGKITGTQNLTGYSYYPVEQKVNIENATVTFDHQNLENNTRKPSDSSRQNFGMHTGLFTDIKNAQTDNNVQTLSIDGLTLSGTVGGSAIINGTVRGKDSSTMAKLSISKVVLDGIRADASDGVLFPLLINSIESFTSLNLNDITTTNSYSNLGDSYAATSLIGNAGETSGGNQIGQYIQLDFSQIALDARKNPDESHTYVHNTTRSIFNTALFLKDFQYTDSNSWGIYNFTKTDATKGGGYYTLGKELSNADGNVRNGGEQFYFYGTEDYVYCAVDNKNDGNKEEAAKYFVEKYLPYVSNEEISTHHQFDINISSMDIIEGCGTYSDPYIIEYGKQLSSVAKVLNGEKPKKNWKIKLNTLVIKSGLSSQDNHTKGNGSNDKIFTWNGVKWEWKSEGQEPLNLNNEDVIKYLRNAYYQLKGTKTSENEGDGGIINLTGNWGGLGSASNPFQGVIVGIDNVTVHIDVKNGSQFGGLIAFSTGSVIKNVKIQYDSTPSIACSSVPNSIDAPFFGGVVGWCIGGDTIVDGVTVTYSTGIVPTTKGVLAHLVPVGGYVGLVGGTEGFGSTTDGKGGGVIFRGTNTSGLASVTVGEQSVDPKSDSSNYFYVNPYVGRVLDGYAISDNSIIDNTDKNYKIPVFTSSASSGLSIDSSGNIEVNSSVGLWLLSAIVNSGVSSTTANGKSRFCNYDTVGSAMPEGGVTDEFSDATPFLIRKFVLTSLKNKINETSVSIKLTDNCDMSEYGNGFRGIGGSYGSISSANRLMNVKSISSTAGNTFTITLKQNRKEYTEEYQTWTSLGTGLFPVLHPTTDFVAKSFILAGYTEIHYYNNSFVETINPIPSGAKLMDVQTNNVTYRLGCSGAGLLAGTIKKSEGSTSKINLKNIKITGDITGSATFAGGLIGLACINNQSNTHYINTIDVENCNYQSPSIKGHGCVGGLFGYVYADSISIKSDSSHPMTGITISSNSSSVSAAKTGVGALVGRCGTKDLTIGGINDSAMLLSGTHNITNNNQTDSGDSYGTGGLVGLLGIRNDGNVLIQNVKLQGNIVVSNNKNINSSGILAGMLVRYNANTSFNNDGFYWSDGGKISATISNIQIAESKNDSVKVKNTKQGGVLLGALLIETATFDNITLGSENSTVTIAGETSVNDSSLGGLFGTVAKTNVTFANSNLTNVNVWGAHNNSSRGSGLLLGYADNGAKLYVRNVIMKNCNVAVNNINANAGIIYAHLNGATVGGYNILIDSCKLGLSINTEKNGLTVFTVDNSGSNSIGLKSNSSSTYKFYSEIHSEIKNYTGGTNVVLFGGKANNNDVKVVGVSVQNSYTPMKDFGTGQSANSYAIRADYTGSCLEGSHNTANSYSPFVTVNPLSSLELPNKTVTGDGAFFSTDNVPLLQKILSEDVYYNINSTSKNFLKGRIENETIALSSFKNSDLNTFIDSDTQPANFPVIVLQTNNSDEANNCLHSIISALTNWELCKDTNGTVTTGNKGFSSIDATSYKWNGNSFVEEENKSLNPSLYVKDNRFYLKSGGYDNKLKRFTLVDVSYADPTTDNSTNVYHLYIPVVVKKMFEYKFSASANLGTTYKTSSYNELSKPVLASHGEPVTVLLNYEYQWTYEEWEDAMKNGQNLLWNFDLGIKLNPNAIPAGTKMTLIDRNQNNQAYFLSTSTEMNEVYFKDFSKAENSWNTDRYLCDDLKLSASQKSNGDYALLGSNKTEEATVRDTNGLYYRPANENDSAENRYNLSITGTGENEKVAAQFYLTLYTPSNATEILNTDIVCFDSLDGNLPTRRLSANSNNNDKPFTKNDAENRLIIGNFFKQIFNVTTTRGEEKITEINATIPLEMTTTISFDEDNNKNASELYRAYASGQRLYQKFDLKLYEYIQGQDSKIKAMVPGTKMQLQFYLGEISVGEPITVTLQEATYSLPIEFCYSDGKSGIPAEQVQDGMQLKAKVELTYLSAAIILDQFPTRSSNESNDGIAAAASSALAYSLDSLNNINHGNDQEAKCGEATPHFYREETGAATLNYVAYEEQNNTVAEGVSELGINGRDGTSFAIHSAALYNVSGVKNSENADTLRVTISLLKKQEDSTYDSLHYEEVSNMENYLSSLEVKTYYKKGEDMKEALSISNVNYTYDFSLNEYDPEVPIQIPITLSVLTGNGFTGTYSNYRIKVTAQLMQGDKPVENSLATDYIVYTNAKISQSFLDTDS